MCHGREGHRQGRQCVGEVGLCGLQRRHSQSAHSSTRVAEGERPCATAEKGTHAKKGLAWSDGRVPHRGVLIHVRVREGNRATVADIHPSTLRTAVHAWQRVSAANRSTGVAEGERPCATAAKGTGKGGNVWARWGCAGCSGDTHVLRTAAHAWQRVSAHVPRQRRHTCRRS